MPLTGAAPGRPLMINLVSRRRNFDLVRPGTALPRMADQVQVRRFCVRWYTIVIAADKDGAGAGTTGYPAFRQLPPRRQYGQWGSGWLPPGECEQARNHMLISQRASWTGLQLGRG